MERADWLENIWDAIGSIRSRIHKLEKRLNKLEGKEPSKEYWQDSEFVVDYDEGGAQNDDPSEYKGP